MNYHTYSRRDSATKLLKKLGVSKEHYNDYIVKNDDGTFTVNEDQVKAVNAPAPEPEETKAEVETKTEEKEETEPNPEPEPETEPEAEKPETETSEKEHDMAKANTASTAKKTVKTTKAATKTNARRSTKRTTTARKPAAATTAATQGPAVRRTISSVARQLILGGLENADVFAKLQEEFDLDDKKKGYPAWYRRELRVKGLLK